MKTVDVKCWELAKYFLSDVPGSTDMDAQEMAEEFQRVVEDWRIELTGQREDADRAAEVAELIVADIERS